MPDPRMTRPLRAGPGLVAAVAVLLGLVTCTLVPDLITGHSPEAIDPAHALLPPSGGHPFGTDQLGRDMFGRVVYGARVSLLVGAAAGGVALVAGSLVGLVAGYLGGWVDGTLMRLVDVLLTFPALLLALGVLAVVGHSATNVALAVGVSNLAAFARFMRAEVLRIRSRPYLEAATVSGSGRVAIILRHVVPNAAPAAISLAMLGLGVSMLASSSLSFLGFGPAPPAADWGVLAAAGRDYLGTAWWMTGFPCAAVVVTVLAVTRLGLAFQLRVPAQ